MDNLQIKVLVIDDDDDDLFLITDYLKGIDTFQITVETEMNYIRACQKIQEDAHDIYIIDYLLGPHTGVELIETSVKAGITKPFILLTGKGDKQIDINATKAGAYDYLIKTEINTEMLERSLRYSVFRYKAYREVSESEKRFRDVFEKSTDIIFILDNEFKLVNFNPALTQVLFYEEDEIKGKPLADFFGNKEAAKAFMGKIVKDEKLSNQEVVFLSKNGEPLTFIASCSKVSGPGSAAYQCIFFDYTTIKKSVADAILKDRTEANHQLVRTLAHEIRNPLTNINLSVNQLDAEVGEDLKLYTDMIRRNSDRINSLLTELMSIAVPASLALLPLEVNELIEETLLSAEDRVKLKGVNLEKDLNVSCTINANKEKLKIALLNIIINGIEAINKAGGKLSISTYSTTGQVHIKISDSGPGIAPEHIDKLFQPYFTGKKNGIGLGLASTDAIVKVHKGSISVSSVQDVGTTFIVSLPLAN